MLIPEPEAMSIRAWTKTPFPAVGSQTVAPAAQWRTKPACSTSHLAHLSGVKTAPIGLTGEAEARITTAFESLDGLYPLFGVSADTLVVSYGEIGEDVVEDLDAPVPLNLVPDLVDCVVEADLSCPQVLDSVAILWQENERCDADVFQIPSLGFCGRLVVAELSDEELALVVS